MALDALLHVPVGFAVANDADARRDGVGNMMHINYMRTELYQLLIWHKNSDGFGFRT
jgi:hypothetical protein